jgi:hypothetical protein
MAATIDKDLTNAVKAARAGKPMQFALFLKGTEGQLLVGKRIPPKQIAETKRATGASSVVKGRCVGEEGTLVFYVAKEPPATLLSQFKKRLKDEAGLTCPVEIRVRADAEAEPAEGEAGATGDAAGAPSTPESPRAGWEKALAEVEPAYLQGLRDHPEKASTLRAVMAFAQGKAEKEDFPAAIAALQKLAEQLGKTPAGSGGKTAPGPEPVKPAGGDLAAQWKARLAEWTPALKAAMATKGPNAAAVGKLLAQASAFSKPGGDMAQALAKLTECHTLATAGTPPTTPAESTQPTEGQARTADLGPSTDEARWRARRKTIEEPYLKAIKEQPGNAGKLRAVLAYADGKAEARDFGKALQGLDSLDKLLQAPTAAPPPASGLVKKRKFLVDRWQRIPQEVRADLQKLKEAIEREMPGEDADELLELAEDYLDDFYGEMKEAIDEDINSGDAQYKSAITTIGDFRTKIAQEPLIQHLKTNKMKVKLSAESILLDALTEVEQALAS